MRFYAKIKGINCCQALHGNNCDSLNPTRPKFHTNCVLELAIESNDSLIG